MQDTQQLILVDFFGKVIRRLLREREREEKYQGVIMSGSVYSCYTLILRYIYFLNYCYKKVTIFYRLKQLKQTVKPLSSTN